MSFSLYLSMKAARDCASYALSCVSASSAAIADSVTKNTGVSNKKNGADSRTVNNLAVEARLEAACRHDHSPQHRDRLDANCNMFAVCMKM